MKEAGEVLIGLFDVLEANTLPGKTTKELDELARRYIRSHGLSYLFCNQGKRKS